MGKVIIIVAMDRNNGIGRNNDLLWRLPNDMKFFREETQNSIVVMGRKNWESIPEKFRPLPNRTNIVLSRNKDYDVPEGVLLQTWDRFKHWLAITRVTEDMEDIFIIGGGEIYEKVLEEDIVDELLITHVDAQLEADVRFPKINEEKWYRSGLAFTQEVDEKHKYSFKTIHYSKK